MRKIYHFILVIFPIILAVLSNLPQNHDDKIIVLLINYKLEISIFVALVVLILQFYFCFFRNEDTVIKIWSRNFLRFIAKEELGGGEYQTRISILRPQKGWRFIIKYLYFILFINFINNFKNGDWKKLIKNIPIHLCSDYLTIYTRYSYPKEDKSYTHFRIY